MEYYSAIKKEWNADTTWINLKKKKKIMLNERNQTKKNATYFMILFVWNNPEWS